MTATPPEADRLHQKTKRELVEEILALRQELDRSRRRGAGRTDLLDLVFDALENISEAFVIYDAQGYLVTCNRNFRELYSYSEEEARPGVHFKELGRIDVERGNVVTGDELGGGEDYLARKAAYRSRLEGSFVVRLKDGRWINTTDRRTSDGGFVSIQSDITELKKKEDELAAAKEEAEAANRAKSEFLANMSHELRTPLNSILGFSEVLAKEAFGTHRNPKYRDYAESIHQAGSYLLRLINDILDLTKIEAGIVEMEETLFKVGEVARDCLALVEAQAGQAGVALAFDGPQEDVFMHADQRHFRQILINLLSNAVKFSPDGGCVYLGVRLDSSGGLDVEIRDQGIGIAPENLDKVLEPFGQVVESHTRGHEGTGLGLPICKFLAELHGGTLSIESEVGKGTTVRVTFPAERSFHLPEAAQSAR